MKAICRLTAVVIGILGLAPTAKLLNPWQKTGPDDSLFFTHLPVELIKCLMIALAGFAIAYLLFRAANHLKFK